MGPEAGNFERHVGHLLVLVVPLFFCRYLVLFTKERGLEVDCNRVQERAYAKAGSILCRSTCLVLYVGANNVL